MKRHNSVNIVTGALVASMAMIFAHVHSTSARVKGMENENITGEWCLLGSENSDRKVVMSPEGEVYVLSWTHIYNFDKVELKIKKIGDVKKIGKDQKW